MYSIKVRFDRTFEDLNHKVRKLMDEMINLPRPLLSIHDAEWAPEADMFETGDEIFLVVSLAGVRKESIEVSFYENHLRIEGKRAQCIPPGTPIRYHQLEMGHGNFERVFRLPIMTDENKMEASYSDGLLTVQIKKSQEARSISVEVTS
jgi:HSP20 family protein